MDPWGWRVARSAGVEPAPCRIEAGRSSCRAANALEWRAGAAPASSWVAIRSLQLEGPPRGARTGNRTRSSDLEGRRASVTPCARGASDVNRTRSRLLTKQVLAIELRWHLEALEPVTGIEPADSRLRSERSAFAATRAWVEVRGIEPRPAACKAVVLPLTLDPRTPRLNRTALDRL